MRETWFIKNVHTRELAISDLDKAPAIRPNETVDFLRYHTKEQIEQSDDLKSAIDLGYLRLIKKRDTSRIVKTTPDDINLSIENVETGEGIRYWGEMHINEMPTIISIPGSNTWFM